MLQIALLFAFVIPAILFFLAQQRILQVISPENREMSPGSVWLQFIPVFGMVWQFIVVTRIARSVSKEMVSKMGDSILDHSQVQIKETDESPTYTIGIAYCILTTFGVIINYATKNSLHTWRYSEVFLSLQEWFAGSFIGSGSLTQKTNWSHYQPGLRNNQSINQASGISGSTNFFNFSKDSCHPK